MGVYQINVTQQIRSGTKLLKFYSSYSQTNNLNKVFEIGPQHLEELIVVKASSEKSDFHLITYITSNSDKYCGFKPSDLIGNNLSLIIPNAIAPLHNKLWRADVITGHLLGMPHMLNLYIKTIDGYIQPANLMIRCDTDCGRGLRYIAAINILKNINHFRSLMITDTDGIILDHTANLAEMMNVGKSFTVCNEDLNFAYKCLNRINDFDLSCSTFGRQFNNIIHDKE